MPENLPAPSAGGWFAEWLTNGKLPGAAKAIAQLVGDTANAGSAWINIAAAKGQQLQQRIRTDTSGSTAVMDALAAEAAKMGVSDPAVVEIALRQFGSSAIRKHLNRASVMKEAADEINTGEPINDDPGEIEDDWLNRFENLASEASSERIQKLLGKILAGEIRSPGKFSFATLNTINVLDTRVGAAISALAPYIFEGDMIPYPARFDFTATFNEIVLLKQYGILGENLRRRCKTGNGQSMMLKSGRHAILIQNISAPEVYFDYIPVTRVGFELFPLVGAASTMQHMSETAAHFLGNFGCAAVDVGYIESFEAGSERFVPVKHMDHSSPLSSSAGDGPLPPQN